MAGVGGRVEVTGLRAVIDALGEVDKKAVQAIRKEITTAAKAVVKDARSRVTGFPISGWGNWTERSLEHRDLSFNPEVVAAGIRVEANRFRKQGVNRGFGYDVLNKTPAGAIFEVMGDMSRVRDERGREFVNSINKRFGKKLPRLLMPAYYSAITPELRDKIRDQIVDEARKAGLN